MQGNLSVFMGRRAGGIAKRVNDFHVCKERRRPDRPARLSGRPERCRLGARAVCPRMKRPRGFRMRHRGVVRRKPCDFLPGAPAGRARPPGGPCGRMAHDGSPGGRPLPASRTMQKTGGSPDNPWHPGRAAVPGRRGARAVRGDRRHPFMPVVQLPMAGTTRNDASVCEGRAPSRPSDRCVPVMTGTDAPSVPWLPLRIGAASCRDSGCEIMENIGLSA